MLDPLEQLPFGHDVHRAKVVWTVLFGGVVGEVRCGEHVHGWSVLLDSGVPVSRVPLHMHSLSLSLLSVASPSFMPHARRSAHAPMCAARRRPTW